MFKKSILSLFLIISIFMISTPMVSADMAGDLIVANAGADRFHRVNAEIVFDASISTIPKDVEPIYRWDMGDGEIRFGMRNTYSYDKVGVYKVRLIVEGKNTELKSTDEIIVHIFDRYIAMISSNQTTSDKDIDTISNIAIDNNIAVTSIRMEDDFSSSQVAMKQNFSREINAQKRNLIDASIIMIIGDDSMESFMEFFNKTEFDISNKLIVFVMTDPYLNIARKDFSKFAQNIFGFPKMSIYNIADIDSSIFDAKHISDNTLNSYKGRYFLGMLDPFYKFNINMMKQGFSLDIIYFLYVILLISIFGLSLRKILGLSIIGVHTLGFTIFSFIILGFIPSLILFTVFFMVSYLVYRLYETDRETLLPGNFMDILMLVLMMVISILFIHTFVDSFSMDITNFMAILLISISSRRLARYTMGMRLHRIFGFFIQDIIFLTINYFLLTATVVRLNILMYPEIYLILIFLLAFLMERYRGLRLMELIRFRSLLNNVTYNKDKQE